MYPTFEDRELVVLRKTGLERGSLVVFQPPEEWKKFSISDRAVFFKRVAALPGDKVEVRGESLMVNGTVLEFLPKDCKNREEEVVWVLEDEVMVLGDNRESSVDSLFGLCEGLTVTVPLENLKFVGKEIF